MCGLAHTNRIYCFFIFIISIGLSLPGSSQVIIRFPADTIEAKPGSTGLVNVLLMNTGIRIEKFLPVVSVNEIRLLNKPASGIELFPTDQEVIPVRFFVPRKINADTVYRLTVTLSMHTPEQTTVQNDVIIKVTKVHQIRVESFQNEMFSDNPAGIIAFQMRCKNLGNAAEPVYFQVHNEYGVESANDKISGFVIPAFSDTIFSIRYKLPHPLNQKKILQLHIMGKRLEGEQTFSSNLMKVHNLKPQAEYIPMNDVNRVTGLNTVALFMRNATGNNPYYELMTDFKHYIGQTEMHYHINGFYYTLAGTTTPVSLLNTYIELNRDRFGLRLGQISRNLELPLYGRGASVRFGRYEKSYFEAGFVNSDNNLISNFKSDGFEASNAVYAKGIKRFGGSFGITYNFLRISDPYNQANSIIAGIGNEWRIAKKHAFQWTVYKSRTDNYQFSTTRKEAEGMAGNFSYYGAFGKLILSSINYYSTNAYAGFLKGALNLDERISYSPGKKLMIWARYYQYKNQPDFFSPYAPLLNFNSLVQTAEGGINLNGKKAAISFKPSLYHESTDYYRTFLQTGPINLESKRFNVTANFQMRKNRFLTISGDIGYSESNVAGSEQYLNWRASASYQHSHFVLNATYQDGAFYAAELIGVQTTSRKYVLINAGLTLKDIRITKKLVFTLGDHLSYHNMYRLWSNNSFANASYNFNARLALVANYSQFQNSYERLIWNTNTQSRLDIGVIKKINTPGRPQLQKNATLDILVYIDMNGNRHYDAGEPVSPNTVVRINEMSMITDMSGRVVFTKVLQGSYNLSIIRQDGYMGESRALYISDNTSLEMPLYKIGILTGSVKIQKEELSYQTDEHVSHIRILAIDANGTMYTALTDDQGQYFFYLPDNTYDVQIDMTSVPEFYEVINTGEKLRISNQTGATTYHFKLFIRKRPAEIKKFAFKTSS